MYIYIEHIPRNTFCIILEQSTAQACKLESCNSGRLGKTRATARTGQSILRGRVFCLYSLNSGPVSTSTCSISTWNRKPSKLHSAISR